MRNIILFVLCILCCYLSQVHFLRAQTTEFSYQGSLKSGSTPANGNHDFEFLLFDASSGGNQVGPAIALNNIPVTDGIFSVKLDFGNQFTGANRFLEIRVRQSGQTGITILSPRQLIGSAPYAVKSLNAENAINATNAATSNNALQLGGIAANQYVQTTDTRLSDARSPLSGSNFYIQNRTTQQTSSNFNISGNGTVGGTFTGNNINATRIGIGTTSPDGLFEVVKTSESSNDNVLLTKFSNSISAVSLIGRKAGGTATSPTAVLNNDDLFIVGGVGYNGTAFGSLPSSFIRFQATEDWTSTANGSRIGFSTVSNADLTRRQRMVIDSNGNVGIGGINTPSSLLHLSVGVNDNIFLGSTGCTGGGTPRYGIGFGLTAMTCTDYALGYLGSTTIINRQAGGTISFRENGNLEQIRINDIGTLSILFLGSGGATALCRNSSSEISTCSSSLRYKSNISNFRPGLDVIRRLRPVSFSWKADSTLDFGLVAEEVARVEPLLVTQNEKGETEGVKYDRLGVVLVNAVNEQQQQIETQQKEIDGQKQLNQSQQKLLDEQKLLIQKQQSEIDALKALVCSQNPSADLCRLKEKKQ